jgi:hypothetical protein
MTIEQLLTLFGAVATLVGAAWALIRIIVRQFEARLDERFQLQEKARMEARLVYNQRFEGLEKDARAREREHMKLLVELPREYVRREDQIRFETGINGKLDALNAKLDLYNERVNKG